MKTVILIGGPTAVGKTGTAIAVAQRYKTAIISADSRQCYQELKIGVARPSEAELQAVPHYFIASHSIHQKVTAATFEQYALQKASELFVRHDVIVMTGGTGLYLKAFCEGFDAIPEVPEKIQAAVRHSYNTHGLQWLQQQVQQLDPAFAATGEMQNPQRLMRALEVQQATGNSILQYRRGQKATRDFNVLKIALDLPRAQLHQNINSRVDAMMQQGQLEEARRLLPFAHLNALQTVGYRELFLYFNKECTLDEAVTAIKTNTRQYAKRQLTWFRKDAGYHWFDPGEPTALLTFVEAALNRSEGSS